MLIVSNFTTLIVQRSFSLLLWVNIYPDYTIIALYLLFKRIFEKKPGHVALKFKAWPKDIEWLPSGSCLELFKENKDGSQLVPQGVPQVVEPDWAKLELDLVKANLKNIKDLMLDSINNWWTEFFEDPSILRKESEDFWVMDRLSSMKGQTDTGFGSPSVVSPLSYVMEKERKVPMVTVNLYIFLYIDHIMMY